MADGASTYCIGVDIGGTNMRCAVIDGNHKLLSRIDRPTLAQEGPDSVLARLNAEVDEAIAQSGVARSDVVAMGLGLPGLIEQRAGLVRTLTNMPGWRDVYLGELFRARTGIPTFIDNDANCAGWGEFRAGAGVGCRDLVMITLGTGIGGAIIIDGKLHVGRDGVAGEIGHICVERGGRPCQCGARGCVESYASASSVVRRFREMVGEGWLTSVKGGEGGEVTAKDVFDGAAAGDPLARHIADWSAVYIGMLINMLAETLNPERCVVFGGMSRAGEWFFRKIREGCDRGNSHAGPVNIEIVPALLGPDAGLIGAADYARGRVEAEQAGQARTGA